MIDMPSADYIGGMYSSVAWQYLTFYSGIVKDGEDNRLMTKKHLSETFPEYDDSFDENELEDYLVYDSEYKKTVPVSRLIGNRKKLSDDEKKIREAIDIALKADELMNEEMLRREAEERRLAREARLAAEAEERLAEEARIKAEEEERARQLAEEATRLAEEDAQRIAAEEERKAAQELSEEIASIAASGESDETKAAMIESVIDRGVMNMNSGKRSPFAFADEDGAEGQVRLPYTRAQYLALPRKKKKAVLMNVKKLINYNATKRLLDALYDMKSDNPRILSRIEALEIRLEEEGRFLPNSELWQNAVQRVKN